MVNKSVQDKNPIMWSCLERPYIERYMENESSHPCGGIFVLILIYIFMKSLYKWQKIVLGVIAFLSFISPWLAKGSEIGASGLISGVMSLAVNTLIVFVLFKIGNKIFKSKK
ncbi:MAG: hypothetical protein PHS54_05425 [Clostridia bacterium]|jgi:4-hydroxybenzoate polyprenyltransferase|nr:hypothetical protein [Clostridia bacterium]